MSNLSKKSEEDWKQKLTPEQYKILREKGTEPRFSGELLNNKEKGVYECMACGASLFSSETKYDSKSGWPSFYEALGKNNLELAEDLSLGMKRIEVKCANCGSHLGHLFDDGPDSTGRRYCINSMSLNFNKQGSKADTP